MIEHMMIHQPQRHGPFDLIGDVHGCADELWTLLGRLGYDLDTGTHPAGRTLIFVGDLVDKGPKILDTVRWVMAAVDAGHALCVAGNHDVKFAKKLAGRNVLVNNGMDKSLAELEAFPPEKQARLTQQMSDFFTSRPSHLILDDGNLIVAHAGIKESLQGKDNDRVWSFCLYGATTGQKDEYGFPVRLNWAADYHGKALVVYGHTAVLEAEWINNTLCIDTGCVYGGTLTALRYPEREIVSVPAIDVHYPTHKPLQRIGV